MNTGAIAEARPLSQNVAEVSDHRMRIRIIEGDRWGSSGYYGRKMLERDGPTAFPAGTHMYLDHPGDAEEMDRPERTLRDLVGALETPATYQGDGLYAVVRIYEHWADVISEMAEDIGVSIRAVAEMEPGERDGRTGPIITSLLEGVSADFVTKAGAGGKIVQVLESARKARHMPKSTEKNKADEASKAEEATANNRRIQLTNALQRAWDGFDGHVFVRDLDEEKKLVYYSVFLPDSVRTYGQKFTVAADDKSAEVEGEPFDVMPQTEYVPIPGPSVDVDESDKSKTGQVTETTKAAGKETSPEEGGKESEPAKEAIMGQTTIDETELAKLRESSGEADSLRDELKESRTNERKAEVKAAKETIRANHEHARRIVSDELHEANVKAPALARALSLDPPLVAEGDNAGSVDEEKLKAAVKEAVGEIQLQVDEASGGVKGFGTSGKEDDEEVTEAELDNLSAGIFGREKVKS